MELNELKNAYLADMRTIVSNIDDTDADNMLQTGKVNPELKEGLNKIDSLAVEGILAKYCHLLRGEVLNHETYKLSDLDLKMMQYVKPGGNYKDIPQEVAAKSKRLSNIKKTGGRTTYYGRMLWERASYTITTLWNRPGNGTNMLPNKERVLSVREAARLQGFRDDYYFYGSKTQHLKQVGNAVPPLIGYQIGERLKDRLGITKSIDLFSGAGGLTAGLKMSGIHSVLCNDIQEQACITLKVNNPEIEVLCGDITTDEVKREIIEKGKREGIELISGGPPCQGYSMAGKRDENDERNRLFEEFVEVVKGIRPKAIVFENVEGLLTYRLGETYREIQEAFRSIGYKIKGRKLLFSEYGVPQRRKRVLLVGIREDIEIEPDEIFPQEQTREVTVYEAIKNLTEIECKEGTMKPKEEDSEIGGYYSGRVSVRDYLDSVAITERKGEQEDGNAVVCK